MPSNRLTRWASWARTSLEPAFSFDIHIHSGAGAYICGEETALIESIEGKRGEPRARPPYPTTNGLWGKPTLVNNVETLANVAPIIRNGAAWYRRFGTPSSPGTKVYTILGNVNVTGLIEVPMGITLREVIAIYAKGMKNDALLQTGPDRRLERLDHPGQPAGYPDGFRLLQQSRRSPGIGRAADLRRGYLRGRPGQRPAQFLPQSKAAESATPAASAPSAPYEILTNICRRHRHAAGPATTWQTCQRQPVPAFQLRPGPDRRNADPKDILKYFRAEVEAHIRLKVCPAGVCAMSGKRIEMSSN